MGEGCFNLNPENVLDIWGISNEVIGNVWVFLIICLIVLNLIALKMKVPFEALTIFNILVGIAFFIKVPSMIIIWVFVGLIVGTLFYTAYAKYIGR